MAAALAGCGQQSFGHDLKGFTQQASTPPAQDILRSIATYRTTKDATAACSLVTPHFLKVRFDGRTTVCQAIARHQDNHDLPKSAKVESIAGDSATVRIAEPTAIKSLYRMKRVGATWKIDDIVEAH